MEWKAAGSRPKSWASSIHERRVSGNQFAPWKLLKAQPSPDALSPDCTSGRAVT